MAIDFLIVGGGIGGAVLANLLGRRGKRVLVLEKSTTPAPQNRPEVLWPGTVEVLRALIPHRFEERWLVPVCGGVLRYRQQTILRIGSDVFAAAGVQPYSTANTRELLMQQAPCEYRRGVEVTEVLRDNRRIVGVRTRDTASGSEQEVLAEWTVGDDGAHSVIRRDCGLPMDIAPFPIELLGFGFDWPANLPAGTVNLWLNEERARSGVLGMPAIPLPEGKGVALIPVWPEAFGDEQRLREALRTFAAQDAALNDLLGRRAYPEGFTRFRLGWSRTPCFGSAGALLMGDAAHPVTPAGGQGANLSVADALVIAEVALARPDQLLAEYARRRAVPAARSLALSRRAARVFSLPRFVLKPGLALLPCAARLLNRRPQLFGSFLRVAASSFQERPEARRSEVSVRPALP